MICNSKSSTFRTVEKSVVESLRNAHTLKVFLEPLIATSVFHMITKSRTYHSSWMTALVMCPGHPAFCNS